MEKPIEHYWQLRLAEVKEALEANHFEAHVAEDCGTARTILLTQILPKTAAKTVSWGSSMTLIASGLYEELRHHPQLEVLDTFEKGLTPEQMIERRRQSLLVDLFVTGTNAVTEAGQLVNLDMIGNRVCGITFGPRHVVILVGRNKIVSDLEEAMMRIKEYAAPANAMRLDKKTPCAKTSHCEECKGPDRICNTWAITEKSFPKGRVRVILINQDLGI